MPWRTTQDAYRIWVSEVMLQQTQVEQVRPYYQRFMVAFPDILSLANAKTDEVYKLWEGLGYYCRAALLHK
ncbi:MAG TPA: A/G-specific adenine glycosylase, partial [bacterium]|nr:A/G-specific adenine glycosylase [bacterium]